MTAKVVDASAVVALLFDEETRDAVVARIAGSDLIAPGLLPYEIGNACIKKIKARPGETNALLRAMRAYELMAIQEVDADMDGVAALARETGLTFYDSAYLWLARGLDAELVTLDDKLAKAAGRSASKG